MAGEITDRKRFLHTQRRRQIAVLFHPPRRSLASEGGSRTAFQRRRGRVVYKSVELAAAVFVPVAAAASAAVGPRPSLRSSPSLRLSVMDH